VTGDVNYQGAFTEKVDAQLFTLGLFHGGISLALFTGLVAGKVGNNSWRAGLIYSLGQLLLVTSVFWIIAYVI